MWVCFIIMGGVIFFCLKTNTYKYSLYELSSLYTYIYLVDTAAVICVHPRLVTDVFSKHGCDTPVQRRYLHFRACMLTAYARVVWGFQIFSQRTYSVWPHVLVRPSWLLFWEPRAAKLFRDFSFVAGPPRYFHLESARLI